MSLPAAATLCTAAPWHLSRADPTDDGAPVHVAGQAAPWGVTEQLNGWGDTFELAAGSLQVDHPGRVSFLLDHGNHVMGYGVSFTDDGAGLQAVMAVPRDELDDVDTARAVRQMVNGTRSALSIGALIVDAEQVDAGDHYHYIVNGARLLELSSVVVPRFDDARIASVAASALTRNGVFMSTNGLPAFPRTAPVLLDAGGDTPDDDDDDTGADEGADDVVQAQANHPAGGLRAGRGTPTAATVGYQTRRGPTRDLSLAGISRLLASTGGDPRMVRAALSNVTTTDAAGVVRPQYVDELLGLLNQGTPAINTFRQGNLTSNPIVFPSWTTLPLVDKQATQKTQIASGPAVIGSKSITVDTYAGGNDVSVQTIDWSSPDFLTAYFQACTEVYGRKIEAAFEAALLAWAVPMSVPADASLSAIIAAAIGYAAGKGLPGRMVLLVSGDVYGDLFLELSGMGPGLFGIVSAGFPTPAVIVGPYLPAGTVIAAMSGAAITFQNSGAPIRLRAVDVSLLGVDVGVYGYFAAGALYPTAILTAAYTPPVGLRVDAPDVDPGMGDMLHDDPPSWSGAKASKRGDSSK
jgi:phage head maturation protease